MSTVIKVEQLLKQYGSLTAVNGISFEVRAGEIFGLLGENGAGKTTTLEIMEGLRRPTSGRVTILGHQLDHDLPLIKNKIGVQLQSSAYYSFLTLREILELFGGFYAQSLPALDLLKKVDLEFKAKAYVHQLSGGQKQRFSIVASLVNDPEIVFLDEPTTGLDPIARRNLWQIIAGIKAAGKTVILTTHYMEEAEILCDRIAIMDAGKIVALDQTEKLIAQVKQPYKIMLTMAGLEQQSSLKSALEKLGRLVLEAPDSGKYELHLGTQTALNQAVKLLAEAEPESFSVQKASLEDAFIELTGKRVAIDPVKEEHV